MAEFAFVASDQSKKKNTADSIQQGQWFGPRTVRFMIAAVRTTLESKSTQRGQQLFFFFIRLCS